MKRDRNIFIIALILLNLFLWLSRFEFKYGIPQVVKYVFSISSIGMIFWFRLKNPSKLSPGGLTSIIVFVFIFWSLFLIVDSVIKIDSLFYIQRVLGQRFFFMPYLLPLILLYTRFDLEFFSILLKCTFILIIPAMIMQLSVLAFGISPWRWEEQVASINMFDIGSWLLLMSAHYYRKRYVSVIIIFYFLIWAMLWAFFGRRGMLIESLFLFLFMIIIRLRSSLIKRVDRMKIYFLGLILIVALLSFGYLLMSTYAFQRGISKEGFEESRGKVFEDFSIDFSSTSDWIFGRGLDGRVLRTIIQGEDTGDLIENGFLHLVLKGGLLYLVPFVLILLRASYLGFFRSRNDLTKALASLLFIHIFMMAYFNLPDSSPRYIMIWIAVSACFNSGIRNHSNEEVSSALNLRFTKKRTSP